jgi:predicted Zn-ribbon and HTH transcriptional regulator
VDTIVFGSFTVQDIIIAAAVVAGIFIVLPVLRRVLRRKKMPVYAQQVRCKECGWQGQASRHAGRCPKCNAPVGDQKAKKYPK